jgi:hypothetical protein
VVLVETTHKINKLKGPFLAFCKSDDLVIAKGATPVCLYNHIWHRLSVSNDSRTINLEDLIPSVHDYDTPAQPKKDTDDKDQDRLKTNPAEESDQHSPLNTVSELAAALPTLPPIQPTGITPAFGKTQVSSQQTTTITPTPTVLTTHPPTKPKMATQTLAANAPAAPAKGTPDYLTNLYQKALRKGGGGGAVAEEAGRQRKRPSKPDPTSRRSQSNGCAAKRVQQRQNYGRQLH